MPSKRFTITALITLVVFASLACSAVSRGGEVGGTAQAVLTQAQGMATQGSQLIGTAQAFATENPGLVGTAIAFATNQGPALIGTAQALATDNPGIVPTLEAMATAGFNQSSAPDDIPVPTDQTISNQYGSSDTLTYSTNASQQVVVDFYKREMPNNGWTQDANGTVESGNVAILKYTKANRTATLTITPDASGSSTYVAIVISGQ